MNISDPSASLQVKRLIKTSRERVFAAWTTPSQIQRWFGPATCQVLDAQIDLRVGGNYRFVFVTDDGTECSFRGTYSEIEAPTRTVGTWLFDGWPDAEAVESVDLNETEGVTELTWKLAFRDKAGRDHMTRFDGLQANFDNVEDLLRALLDPKETVSG